MDAIKKISPVAIKQAILKATSSKHSDTLPPNDLDLGNCHKVGRRTRQVVSLKTTDTEQPKKTKKIPTKGKARGKKKPDDTPELHADSDEEVGDTWQCSGCKTEGDQQGIECERCSKWFCLKCQDASAELLGILNSWRCLHWYCDGCESLAKQAVADSMLGNSLSAKLEHVIEQKVTKVVQKAVEKVDKATKQMESFMETTSELSKKSYATVAAIKAQSNQTPVNQAGNPPSQGVVPPARVVEAVDELVDRERRKNNIIIRGIPELKDGTPEERSTHDHNKTNQMMQELKIGQVTITKSVRIGKRVTGKDRMLLLTIDDFATKKRILGEAKNLRKSNQWEGVFISPDLTPSEREEGKKLRDELRTRRARGERVIIRRGRIVPTETDITDRRPAQPSPNPTVTPPAQQTNTHSPRPGPSSEADATTSTEQRDHADNQKREASRVIAREPAGVVHSTHVESSSSDESDEEEH